MLTSEIVPPQLNIDFLSIGLWFVGIYILVKFVGNFVDYTFARIFKTHKDCEACPVWDRIGEIIGRQVELRDRLHIDYIPRPELSKTLADMKELMEARFNALDDKIDLLIKDKI